MASHRNKPRSTEDHPRHQHTACTAACHRSYLLCESSQETLSFLLHPSLKQRDRTTLFGRKSRSGLDPCPLRRCDSDNSTSRLNTILSISHDRRQPEKIGTNADCKHGCCRSVLMISAAAFPMQTITSSCTTCIGVEARLSLTGRVGFEFELCVFWIFRVSCTLVFDFPSFEEDLRLRCHHRSSSWLFKAACERVALHACAYECFALLCCQSVCWSPSSNDATAPFHFEHASKCLRRRRTTMPCEVMLVLTHPLCACWQAMIHEQAVSLFRTEGQRGKRS